MMSDAQRIERVKYFRDNKKLDRVLLSHDIHTKHKLVRTIYIHIILIINMLLIT